MLVRITVPVVLLLGLALAGLWVGTPHARHPAGRAAQLAEVPAQSFQCLFQDSLWQQDSVYAELMQYQAFTTLRLYDGRHNNSGLVFTFQGTPKEGVYMLDDPFAAFALVHREHYPCKFATDAYYQGVLMIDEHDKLSGRIAGTFEFLAYADACRQIIRVQQGRFNVRYHERDIR